MQVHHFILAAKQILIVAQTGHQTKLLIFVGAHEPAQFSPTTSLWRFCSTTI